MAANFTFDVNIAPTMDELRLLFMSLMTVGPKPTVSLGAVTTATATAWLNQMRDTYSMAIGKRSDLIKNMNMVKKVTMMDLTDAPTS
jgi:hypothetical protein